MNAEQDEIKDRIYARWGSFANSFGIGYVPVTSRTVLSVETVMGIIENGGFSYLLEDTLSGDENLTHAIEAFRRIGGHQASKIISEVMSELNPGILRRSPEGRYKKYLSLPEDWRYLRDVEFCDACPEVVAKLAQFIHDNRDVIEKELALPKGWLPHVPE